MRGRALSLLASQLSRGLTAAAAVPDSRAACVFADVLLRQYSSLHQASAGPASQHAIPRGTASTSWPAALPTIAGQVTSTRSMFIQTQNTPNPLSLMFAPGRSVLESGTHEFANAREGMASPLARRLFAIDGVTGVFFGSDFITVTKRDDSVAWAVLKPDIFAAIMDHYSSGDPLFLDDAALASSDTAIHPDDTEVVQMIKELLETRIRPAVQEDGGDIVYKGFEPDTGTVILKMMGACSGCPSSSVTLKSGIENMLMHYIPEVKQVIEADPDEAEEEGHKQFKKLEEVLSN